tara:strand:+ start:1740 stop:2603 length:864 start_codon:yes stop_codon:yes gene_type:complete
MIDNILYTIALVVLFVGSYTDFKKREVADTINWGFLFVVLGVRLMYSLSSNDYLYFMDGAVGALLFFIIACLMFYTGQWGGGDSKMLLGLGAVFGFSLLSWTKFQLIEVFLINVMIVGGFYGMIYSIVLSIKHWSKFKIKFKHYSKKIKKTKIIVISVCVLLLILSFFVQDPMLKILDYVLILFLILTVYFYLFAKGVEEAAMIRNVNVSELTEGEWIVDDIVVDGKKVCGPKDLGIEKEQIEELERLEKLGKVDKILIKVGIPFVPSFLLSFLVTVLFGNWLVFLF